MPSIQHGGSSDEEDERGAGIGEGSCQVTQATPVLARQREVCAFDVEGSPGAGTAPGAVIDRYEPRYPFNTGCSPLDESGNPGVNGVSYRGGT